MHPNEELIRKLFSELNAKNHEAMAKCYSDNATFKDIAFKLSTRKQIHAMWHLICETDIQATVNSVTAKDSTVVAEIVDHYHFEGKNKVVNPITSRFKIRGGLITEQVDDCDPLKWARQALGGIQGEIAGRLGFVRRWKARKKLNNFIREHRQYKES